jgi:DNA-binding NtrC family response regulator
MMNRLLKILVVDDKESIIEIVKLYVGKRASVIGVSSPDSALEFLKSDDFDVVLTDYNLGGKVSGLSIFKAAREKDQFVTTALMTGDDAAAKMKEIFQVFGALMIEKPLTEDHIENLLATAKNHRAKREAYLVERSTQTTGQDFVAESRRMKEVLKEVRLVARKPDLAIHMAGPTGTGKSSLAKYLHDLSGLKKDAFIKVNCGNLQDLALSRLFGHAKGAFTGATSDSVGFVEQANGGTLFLDEFHTLKPDVQTMLLTVLDTGQFERLGETKPRESRFRLITASSQNLAERVQRGEMSPDLWYRIAGRLINVPSLSERKECIPKLVYRRLKQAGAQIGAEYQIAPDALEVFCQHSWAGNIRDLNNCVDSLTVELSHGDVISKDRVLKELRTRPVTTGRISAEEDAQRLGLVDAVKSFERREITRALSSARGNVVKAADTLRMPRSTLKSKMLKLGMQ